MEKKFGLFVVMAAIVATIGGCQKEELTGRQLADEVQPQFVVNNPMFEGLNEIAFSVEDSRLVFENEEEFQKGIDFLANLGDKNFPAFEKVIGFDSYRKVYENDSLKSSLFVDELYQVLLNPEKEIVVGNYLFREEPESEQTIAFEYDMENCNLKSTGTSPTYTFSWNEDAFAIIKGEEDLELKSISSDYCTGNIRGDVDFLFKSSNWGQVTYNDPYAYYVRLKGKLTFQTSGIFKSIISKIKLEESGYECYEGRYCNDEMYAKFYFESVGDAIFKRKNRSKIVETVYEEGYTHLPYTWEQSWRPFYGTRKVECYNITMKFGYNIYTGALPPHYNGFTEEVIKTLTCNESQCQP